ncbi:MAG: anthranilate phosphoribosyltransferase [Gammaproteobacteria bacterium]|nr:anthranilate phosphoribosyltransferase [Gammaproteobacteria bacterium]
MNMQDALERLTAGEKLTRGEAREVFGIVMAGEATPAQIAGLLIALRMRGESTDEVAGAALAMRAVSTKVDVDVPHLVDTCGTGGSGGAKLFNISTAAAFAAAPAGAHGAKHGNRGMTSRSGSADVLEAAGVSLDLAPEEIARCITEVGVGFLFAQVHHGAMRHAGPVRRELGVRTVFNVLGPLTNPAGARRQVIGVFSREWQRTLAEVAALLGAERVLVVHADGLDELSIAGMSHVVELDAGTITEYDVEPADFGLARHDVAGLRADSPAASLALVEAALDATEEAAADIVALNAGAAIYAAGVTLSLSDGVTMAQDVIASGQARERLNELVRMSRLIAAG